VPRGLFGGLFGAVWRALEVLLMVLQAGSFGVVIKRITKQEADRCKTLEEYCSPRHAGY
jgi:hypothetical protein